MPLFVVCHGIIHYQSLLPILKTFITSSAYFLIILRSNSPGILFMHTLVGALLAVAILASQKYLISLLFL